MKLNCDLGESFGVWKMPVEDEIMAFLNQANIACGFHAGDPITMKSAISLALKHNVEIGAHPAYPDLIGFGRRSMQMSKDELIGCIQYQVSALDGLASIAGGHVAYVKPHGAMYNDMMRDNTVRGFVLEALSVFQTKERTLPLMMQAHPDYRLFEQEATKYNVPLVFEAFSDRLYQPNGLLTPRSQSNAVLNHEDALLQAKMLIDKGEIVASDQSVLTLKVDSLCVHGDTPSAVAIAKHLHDYIGNKFNG